MTDAPIDLDVLNELKDATGAEFAAELVNTFLDEAPGMMTELKTALANGDAEGYRRAAHSLKSNASTFGATLLSEKAREIEVGELPASDDPADAEALQIALDSAGAALRDLINA